jgi:hypothetical protein
MALTLSRVAPSYVVGNRRQVDVDVTFDSSNPDDGESLTPADVGLKRIEAAVIHGLFLDAGNDAGILGHYDISEQKLVPIWGNAGTASVLPEVTAATDISAYSGRITFRGW